MGKGTGRRLPALAPARVRQPDRTWTRPVRVADLHRSGGPAAVALELDGQTYIFAAFHSTPVVPGGTCSCAEGADCVITRLAVVMGRAHWVDGLIEYHAAPSGCTLDIRTADGAPVGSAAALELRPGLTWMPVRWSLRRAPGSFFMRSKTPEPAEPMLQGLTCSDCAASTCGHDALLDGQLFGVPLVEDLLARPLASTGQFATAHPALPDVSVTYYVPGALRAAFGGASVEFAKYGVGYCMTIGCEGPSDGCVHMRFIAQLVRR